MNPRLIEAAVEHGIVSKARAEQAWRAADAAGIAFYIGCAFLMQESGGGDNVFGHDRERMRVFAEIFGETVDVLGPPIWHGRTDRVEVTRERYEAYKVYRDIGPTKRMQGVGPMQLTWWELQDRADKDGGCWYPSTNMEIGFEVLAELKMTNRTWSETAGAYNGGPDWRDKPAAITYSVVMLGRFADWRRWTQVGAS